MLSTLPFPASSKATNSMPFAAAPARGSGDAPAEGSFAQQLARAQPANDGAKPRGQEQAPQSVTGRPAHDGQSTDGTQDSTASDAAPAGDVPVKASPGDDPQTPKAGSRRSAPAPADGTTAKPRRLPPEGSALHWEGPVCELPAQAPGEPAAEQAGNEAAAAALLAGLLPPPISEPPPAPPTSRTATDGTAEVKPQPAPAGIADDRAKGLTAGATVLAAGIRAAAEADKPGFHAHDGGQIGSDADAVRPKSAESLAPAAAAWVATPAAGPATGGAAAPATARLAAQVGSGGFAAELGAQLTTFVRQGIEHARLELHPAELGPVTVQLQLDGDRARIHLTAEQAPTRQALEQALPQLASSLREAGLTLSGGGVFEQPQQAPSERRGEDAGASRRSDSGRAGDDSPLQAASAPAQRRRGVVDLVA